MTYIKRHIDQKLLEWKDEQRRKPLLIRGARQVGKSTAIREFGKKFHYLAEVNLEKQPDLRQLFTENIDVKKTCEKLSIVINTPIQPGETLLFIDEIQVSQEAIMSLRYFKEDYPELHVIAAGSLLEFALEELPSFAVGRVRSLFMYPLSFDEFLMAQGLDLIVDYKKKNTREPLPEKTHKDLVEQLRSFYLVGGMPAAVIEWVETHNYLDVTRVHLDILSTYLDDFSKYKKKISPLLLRQTLRSVALQIGQKFVCAQVDKGLKSTVIKEALNILSLAGLIIPVVHTSANGLPLGAEENNNFSKYLFFDVGVMQTMLGLPSNEILISSETDFVNKGGISEMFAGLEMQKYADCYQKAEMHYWQNVGKNSQAKVDYVTARNGKVVPIEVKAATQGSMQSLWIFMRGHHLHNAIRTSLENFGEIYYYDSKDSDAERHVDIIPLYAISSFRWPL